MTITKTKIDGLFYLEPNQFSDKRGFFAEIVHLPELEKEINKPFTIKQVNHARSLTNVTRGLHAENWNKLIRVASGTAFCALADVRPGSATFGQVETFILGQGEKAQAGSLFVSQGIANGYCAISGPVDYIYLVDKLYQNKKPEDNQAISLFDPDLNISWPIPKEKMLLSSRDQNCKTLRQLFPQKF